ncbi:hypothetical protein GGI02_005338, partial [Coemansia sp. RSA 2322]
MGTVRDRLHVLFRWRHSARSLFAKPPAAAASNHTTAASSDQTAISDQPTLRNPPLLQPRDRHEPFSSYDAYNCESRQYITTDSVHVLKSFPSDADQLPLEDEGIGRLKNVYEAWLPQTTGSVSRDRVSGIYILTIVNSSLIDGTTYCGESSTTRPIRKHYVQCLYAGSGARRACTIPNTIAACTGAELWIKGSMPLAGPWIQSLHIPPAHRLNKLCLIAAPKPDLTSYINPSPNSLTVLPDTLTRFELDSDLFVYICRLVPCAAVCHTAAPSHHLTSDPPVFEPPRLRRAATTATAASPRHRSSTNATPAITPDTRSIYIH